MAEGGHDEEIPLISHGGEDHDGGGDDDGGRHHEEETDVGGEGRFDPLRDDRSETRKEKARRRAKAFFSQQGFRIPEDFYVESKSYSGGEVEYFIAENGFEWYKVEEGLQDGERAVGFVPVGNAPQPFNSLRIALGLEPISQSSSEVKAEIQREIRKQVEERFPNAEFSRLELEEKQRGAKGIIMVRGLTVEGRWTDEKPHFQARDPSKLANDLPKSVTDALGEDVLAINQSLDQNESHIETLQGQVASMSEKIRSATLREELLHIEVSRLAGEKEGKEKRVRELEKELGDAGEAFKRAREGHRVYIQDYIDKTRADLKELQDDTIEKDNATLHFHLSRRSD